MKQEKSIKKDKQFPVKKKEQKKETTKQTYGK